MMTLPTGTRLSEELRANGRKVRTDALPEHITYQDTGCELAPSCLTCPLERCQYDDPVGARKLLERAWSRAL